MKITACIDKYSRVLGPNIIKVNLKYSDKNIKREGVNWNIANRRVIRKFFPETPETRPYFVTYETCEKEDSNLPFGFPFPICWLPEKLSFNREIRWKRTVRPITLLERIAMYFKKPLQST